MYPQHGRKDANGVSCAYWEAMLALCRCGNWLCRSPAQHLGNHGSFEEGLFLHRGVGSSLYPRPYGGYNKANDPFYAYWEAMCGCGNWLWVSSGVSRESWWSFEGCEESVFSPLRRWKFVVSTTMLYPQHGREYNEANVHIGRLRWLSAGVETGCVGPQVWRALRTVFLEVRRGQVMI